jgi:hypothetical protein
VREIIELQLHFRDCLSATGTACGELWRHELRRNGTTHGSPAGWGTQDLHTTE